MNTRQICTSASRRLPVWAVAPGQGSDSGISKPADRGLPKQIDDACSSAKEESSAARNAAQCIDLDCRDRHARPKAQSPWEMPRAVALMLTLLRMLGDRRPRRKAPPRREWNLPNGCVFAVRCSSR